MTCSVGVRPEGSINEMDLPKIKGEIDRCGTCPAVAGTQSRPRASARASVIREPVAGLLVVFSAVCCTSPRRHFDAPLRSHALRGCRCAPVHLAPLDCGSRALRGVFLGSRYKKSFAFFCKEKGGGAFVASFDAGVAMGGLFVGRLCGSI